MDNNCNLGLNAHHEYGLDAYLKFCRRERGDCLRSVKACFQDSKITRLTDETFTKEEVVDLLDLLTEEVENEVEMELIHRCHSDSVLLASLFIQAQKWHLDLNVDLTQLENQEKIASIKQFETSGSQRDSSPLKKMPQLTPLKGETGGPTALLEAHIEKLNAEKAEFVNQLKDLEKKVIELSLEKENIQIDKSASEKEVNFLKTSLSNKKDEEEFSQIMGEMKVMQRQLSSKEEENKEEQEKLRINLEAAEKSLKQIQAQLQLAEKELEKKFSQTGAYHNMKKIMNQKNSQLKQLRMRLEKYEPLENEQPLADED